MPNPTEPDESFERYARLVRSALGVPVALVSLVSVEGQFFPGATGLPAFWQQARCTGLSHSFCQYVVAHDSPLIVVDARNDPVLADNRAIDDLGVIAYAGFPLHDADGAAVGSLCAIDTAPRSWTQTELGLLADLAATAAAELALRRSQSLTELAAEAERSATARLAEVTETMAVGYLSMDKDWRITYVNAAAVEALGTPQDTLVGAVIWDLFPATVGTDFEAGYRRAADTGQVVTFDAFYPEPLNSWYEVRATPEAAGIALYFVDITARRRAQEAAELASAQVSALGQIALSLAAADDISELVVIMAEQGLNALGADGGSVAVPDPLDATQLLSYITANFGQSTRASFGRVPLVAELPVAAAARSGHRVLLRDQAECAAMSDHVLEANAATGCQAWASIPLRAAGTVIGVLTAGWSKAQTFPPDQLRLLDSFAAQCGQALQRLHSRDAERRAGAIARRSAEQQAALVAMAQELGRTETRAQVLAVLRDHGAALLGAAAAGLALVDTDGTHVDVLTTEELDPDVRQEIAHLPADTPLPIVQAAIGGTAFFLPDAAAAEALFPGCSALYGAANVEASAEVPLRTGSRILGTLSTAFTNPRVWTLEERELLEAMAALTTQAISRIAAHEAEQSALAASASIAETLQRAMLTAPPQPDHLQIAVRYAAATDHAEIGGDWYDAFITASGITSLVVGDVTGHDMRAAAIMGQMRNLVRGIGYTLGETPAAVLSAVDSAAAGLGLKSFATVVLAQIEQDAEHQAAGTRLLRWSNAGHPPPLLLTPDGCTTFLERTADLMLGFDPEMERHNHEHVLSPGSMVLLYTDGLIERRSGTLDDGMAWLAQAAAQLGNASPDELCDHLLSLVGNHLDDDVALLALRAQPEPPL